MSSSNPLYCISCGKELNNDHLGIKCIQNHNICTDCVKFFIDSIFENPNYSIPVKCPDCNQEVPSLIFERQLNAEQLEVYQIYMIQNKISSDEKFQSCPHCNYFEIWMKESSANFFYCKNPGCKKLTCAVCIRDVQLPSTDQHLDYFELESLMIEDLDLEDDEETYENSLTKDEGIFYHFGCGSLKKMKESIEKTIEKGSKRRCPTCKLAGRKDDACTHMTCPKCMTVWCYFCQKSVQEIGDEDIFKHNQDWECDIGSSCPMYLTQISDIDSRWPCEDEKCLDRFHNILTKKLLKSKIEKIGLEEYKKILQQFPNIKNSVPRLEELEDDDVKNPFIIDNNE